MARNKYGYLQTDDFFSRLSDVPARDPLRELLQDAFWYGRCGWQDLCWDSLERLADMVVKEHDDAAKGEIGVFTGPEDCGDA